MPKKRIAESAVIAFRPWPLPANGFPIHEFDNVPDHALADRLNEYCVRWVEARFGSHAGWEQHLVKQMQARARRRSQLSMQNLRPGPGVDVPSTEECLASIRSDARSLLEHLEDEPGVLVRHARPGIYVNTPHGAFQVGPRRGRMKFVADVQTLDKAQRLAKYLNERRAAVQGFSWDTYAVRFGALRHRELDEGERVRLVEDLEDDALADLRKAVRSAERVLAEAGLVSKSVGEYRGGLSDAQWELLKALACEEKAVVKSELAEILGWSASKVEKDAKYLREQNGRLIASGAKGYSITDEGRKFWALWRGRDEDGQ
ncbi:MAG: hypothetical protein R3F49_25555 [Planctomycetota bacterium]